MISEWHDFFLMVGGGAAGLTGLVFVAMTLNLGAILNETTHKHRAINTLTGFTAIVVICALALMGDENYQILGIEWLLTAFFAACIYIHGITKARLKGKSRYALSLRRLLFGAFLYIAQIIGAAMLLLGYIVGLYVAGIAMVVLLAFTITGAWLLLVGVEEEKKDLRNLQNK
jgi:hypothetical protein